MVDVPLVKEGLEPDDRVWPVPIIVTPRLKCPRLAEVRFKYARGSTLATTRSLTVCAGPGTHALKL